MSYRLELLLSSDKIKRTTDCLHTAELWLSSDKKEIATDCFHIAELWPIQIRFISLKQERLVKHTR